MLQPARPSNTCSTGCERSGIRRVVLALGQNNEDLADGLPAGPRTTASRSCSSSSANGWNPAARSATPFETAGIAGRFVVVNGDVFVDFDFAPALEAHERARRGPHARALAEVDDPVQFGVAAVDEHELVTGFVEKPPPGTEPSNLVNAGVWIFEPGLVDEIPPGAVRVEETLFPSLVARRRTVLGYRFAGTLGRHRHPARYLALSKALLASAANGSRPASACFTATANVTGIVRWARDSQHRRWARRCRTPSSGRTSRSARGRDVSDTILADGVVVGDRRRV